MVSIHEAFGDALRVGRGWGIWAALVAGSAVLAGCDERLKPIEPGLCGNDAIEIESGEDCEPGFTNTNYCYDAENENACRYGCPIEVPEAGAPVQHECPTGWKCGADFVCRKPTEKFVMLGSPLATEAVIQTLIADFDGDARGDVVTVGKTSIEIDYIDESGLVGRTTRVPSGGSFAAVGDLSGDGNADLAMVVGHGIGVMNGQRNRMLEPAVFPMMTVNMTDRVYLLSIDAVKKTAGDEMFALFKDTSQQWNVLWMEEGVAQNKWPTWTLGSNIDGFAVGWAGPSKNQCQKIVLVSGSTATVRSPCQAQEEPDNIKLDWSDTSGPISLPGPLLKGPLMPGGGPAAGGLNRGGVFFFPVNGDAYLDLVVAVSQVNGSPALAVAYGLKDGTFSSVPPANEGMTKGDNIAGVYYENIGALPPLDLAYLDEDALLDIIDPNGLAFGVEASEPGKAMTVERGDYGVLTNMEPWKYGIAGDFNLDDAPDVVLSTGHDLVFWNNVGGGLFNQFEIASNTPISNVAVGDFDGDTLLDIAFAEETWANDNPMTQEQSLKVAYGKAAGAPEAPVSAGRFSQVEQIIPMQIAPLSGESRTDLLVLDVNSTDADGATPSRNISALLGSPVRQLQAPIFFNRLGDLGTTSPLLPFIGQFYYSTPSTPGGLDVAGIMLDSVKHSGDQFRMNASLQGAVLDPGPVVTRRLTDPPLSLSSEVRQDWLMKASGVVVDLNKDGQNEIVIGLPMLKLEDGVEGGRVVLVSTDPATGGAKTSDVIASAGVIYTSLHAGDVDGDGDTDLFGIEFTLMKGKGPNSYATTPVVFRNDGAGALLPPEPLASLAGVEWCRQPTEGTVKKKGVMATDIALIDAVPDEGDSQSALPKKKVVIVGPSGTYIIKNNIPECIPGSPDGDTIAAGDLTGDRIDDLVIGAAGSTYILKAVPARP